MTSRTRWICPRCGRPFGRPNRPHTCLPALSLDAYFAERPPAQRRIFDAVAAHMRELDGVDVEAVSVGILFKASRTFAELRRDGLALTLLLARELRDPRVRRSTRAGANRMAHVFALHDAEDLDQAIRDWLTEAYLGASA
ncbi:MAG TPA: DUF5655 domain-containing protein [Dehalococcoidia bacterium]|nr:DUF5655 domain-containing protein [Dehalococcoidia bacterium]